MEKGVPYSPPITKSPRSAKQLSKDIEANSSSSFKKDSKMFCAHKLSIFVPRKPFFVTNA
jgi:hypothetical protein